MKTTFLKTLRNFLVANVCVVLPLWAVTFSWMPEQVTIYTRWVGGRLVSVVANGAVLPEEHLGTWEDGHVWRFNLPRGMSWKNLSCSLQPGVYAENVARVEWLKWKLVRVCKSGDDLERRGKASDEYVFRHPRSEWIRLESGPYAWALAGIELLLLAGSILAALRIHGQPLKPLFLSAAGVGFALALLMQMSLPVQLYMANRSAFSFGASELTWAVAWHFLGMWGLATVALFFLSRCFGRWVMAPVLAFTICAYLESGILARNQPDLNGDWTFFSDRSKTLVDACIWCAVFVVVSVLHPVMKPRYGVVGLCLSALILASVFEARVEPKADTSKLAVQDFSPINPILHSVVYSTNRNVMLFVIDSLEREQAHAIMEDPDAGPALRERFRGFTEYVDNVGACNKSLVAVPNMFTGKYPESVEGLFDYFVSFYSRESAMCNYLDAGDAVFIAPEAMGFGYCNRMTAAAQAETGERQPGCFQKPDKSGTGWTLADLRRFRWLPFGLKGPYADMIGIALSASNLDHREWRVYPILEKAPVSPSEKGTFLFVHTVGVHIPVQYDRDGDRLFRPNTSSASCKEMGIFLMRLLGELFDSYREKGIYDSSLIIVLADHGRHYHSSPGNRLPPNGKPFLWIKPAGSRHDFRSSTLPTSHAKIASVLKEASQRPLSEEDIENLLQSKVRRYRWVRRGLGPGWREWTVDEAGSVVYTTGMLHQVDFKDWRPVEPGRSYSLDRKEMGQNNLDIAFEQVGYWPKPVMHEEDKSLKFIIRVPDPDRRYTLNLALECYGAIQHEQWKSYLRFRQANCEEEAEWKTYTLADRLKIVLTGLIPDPDGRVEIEGERCEGLTPIVHLAQILVEEE